jgi:hypothetical protein
MSTVQNYSARKLSNIQVLLLNMFETDLSEEDLKEVKNLLSRHFFEKAQKEADNHMNAHGISTDDIEKKIKEMNKNRTEFKKKMRAVNESSN